MNEHSYIDSVNKHVSCSYDWKIADKYTCGIPDSFYEGDERDLWAEYKYIKPFPVKNHTMIDLTDPKRYLSKLQQRWLSRRQAIRNDAWVIVGSEFGGVIFRGLGWQKPISVEEFKTRCVPARYIAASIIAFVNGKE